MDNHLLQGMSPQHSSDQVMRLETLKLAHERMKDGSAEDIVDLADHYHNYVMTGKKPGK